MKYKIRISPLAVADMQELGAYIALDNPQAAEKLKGKIISDIERLSDFPKIGVALSQRINFQTDYRFLVCGMYLIFYKVEEEYISVYRILNASRDYLSILFADDLPKE